MAEQQNQSSSKLENQLVGKRVILRSFDWKSQLTGVLIKAERHVYVIRQDNGAIMGVLKHSCGAIAPVPEETAAQKTTT